MIVAGTSTMDDETFLKHWNLRHRSDLGLNLMEIPSPHMPSIQSFHRYVHLHNPTSHEHKDLDDA